MMIHRESENNCGKALADMEKEIKKQLDKKPIMFEYIIWDCIRRTKGATS